MPEADWLERQFSRYEPDELKARWQDIARGMKDAQPHFGQRLWPLDPLPAVLPESDWAQLEAGLCQRAQLLNLLLQDAYGQQQMLREGCLHPALYYNNPAWLQPCHGMLDSELGRLLFYAVDLVRDDNGECFAVNCRVPVFRLSPNQIEEEIGPRIASLAANVRDQFRQLAPD